MLTEDMIQSLSVDELESHIRDGSPHSYTAVSANGFKLMFPDYANMKEWELAMIGLELVRRLRELK